MSQRNLDRLFALRAVAVVGTRNRPRIAGATVMRELPPGDGIVGIAWALRRWL